MVRTAVKSSSIKSIGHDPVSNALEVEFVNGSLYRYTDVPADIYAAVISPARFGDSIGRSFQSLIRGGGFGFEKVPPPESTTDEAPTGD